MEEFIYKHRKKIGIILGVLLVAIVIVSVFNIVWDNISARVNIIVAPSIAKVKVGDAIFDANGEHRLLQGEYAVEISADGFYTKNGQLVAIGGESVSLAVFLEPTDENENWYETHPEDNLIMGEIKNSETVAALQEMGEEYPILNILPYNVEYFTDNYSKKVKYSITYRIEDNEEGFVIVIDDYMGGAESLAYRWLKNNGLDTDSVVIEYNDKARNW